MVDNMMRYVLDTGFFVIARGYYPTVFPSFWNKFTEAVENGIVSSVSEVKKELENYAVKQTHLAQWISDNNQIFERPNDDVQQNVSIIMGMFRKVLDAKKRLKGGPWADPFVIARAWNLKGTVVTGEKSDVEKSDKSLNRDEITKIPDVCAYLSSEVRCITPEDFMREMGWSF